ncbi:MAG: hypothetical protein ABIA74_02435 [bacterium]
MKFRIIFLILNLFIFFNTVTANVGVDSSGINSSDLFEPSFVKDNSLIQLEYPDIKRILELAKSFESKSVRVRHLKNTAISLGALSVLTLIGYKIYKDNFIANVSANKSDEEHSSSSTTGNKKEKSEFTQSDYWSEKINDRLDKRTISFWGKEAIRKGIYLGGITSLVGIISTSTELTSQFVRSVIGDLIESGSMQNTFLTLKDALVFYLNWMAELLHDLADTEIKNAASFTSYSGLIDGIFVWVHGLENFLALVLSRARIEFGNNSLKYRSILAEQKQVLEKTNLFINSLQEDMSDWDENGICKISDKTFKYLRSLTAQILKFSQNMQLLLYKGSVGIAKSV